MSSGFIKNLQSTEYQTGRQNGDIHGASIVSTQKITEGKYEAENQITLLPGFEATAHDAFSAEIKPQSLQYQWQYALTDHLGNLRVLFADKNGDGLIRQDTNSVLNEVLSIRNYSPFGLELGGSHKNLDYQNPYRFGGKEVDAFSSYLDFGGRWYDSNRSGWNQIDPHAENYNDLSGYSFCANNPILYIDPDGRDIGYSQASQTTDKKTGVTTITYNVNVSMAVMNSSSMSSKEYQKAVSSFTSQLNKAVSGTFNAGDKTKIVFQAGNIDVRNVSSMSDVKTTDHLMVVVDDVTGKSAKGGEAGGLAEMGGKIAYVEKGDASFTAGNMVHEFGHNIGLAHNWDSGYKDDDGETNYMGYGNVKNQMVGIQLNQSLLKYKFGELNRGQNYETLTKDYNTNGYTTQQMPMNYNVNRGGKIPKRLQN